MGCNCYNKASACISLDAGNFHFLLRLCLKPSSHLWKGQDVDSVAAMLLLLFSKCLSYSGDRNVYCLMIWKGGVMTKWSFIILCFCKFSVGPSVEDKMTWLVLISQVLHQYQQLPPQLVFRKACSLVVALLQRLQQVQQLQVYQAGEDISVLCVKSTVCLCMCMHFCVEGTGLWIFFIFPVECGWYAIWLKFEDVLQ